MLFADREAWRAWLTSHHESAPGFWMRIARKGGGLTSVSYAEAVEEALCFGWIDGQKRKEDESAWLQRFTPRGRKSIWSKTNVRKVEALIAAGRMQPAGMRTVAAAKADGRWDAAYEPASKMPMPAELQAALDAEPEVAAFFATLKSGSRYAILFHMHPAKRPETRAKRLAQYLAMLRRGEAPHLL